ncbi:MAG: hypothetical protein ACNA7H_08515 [Desulfotignum sp.]
MDEDRRSGRFLLTGSPNLMVLPKVTESLAGRMETVTLGLQNSGIVNMIFFGF